MEDASRKAASGASSMEPSFVERFVATNTKSRRIIGHILVHLGRNGPLSVDIEYELPSTMTTDEIFEDLPVAITHEWLHYALFKIGVTQVDDAVEKLVEELAKWSVNHE